MGPLFANLWKPLNHSKQENRPASSNLSVIPGSVYILGRQLSQFWTPSADVMPLTCLGDLLGTCGLDYIGSWQGPCASFLLVDVTGDVRMTFREMKGIVQPSSRNCCHASILHYYACPELRATCSTALTEPAPGPQKYVKEWPQALKLAFPRP